MYRVDFYNLIKLFMSKYVMVFIDGDNQINLLFTEKEVWPTNAV